MPFIFILRYFSYVTITAMKDAHRRTFFRVAFSPLRYAAAAPLSLVHYSIVTPRTYKAPRVFLRLFFDAAAFRLYADFRVLPHFILRFIAFLCCLRRHAFSRYDSHSYRSSRLMQRYACCFRHAITPLMLLTLFTLTPPKSAAAFAFFILILPFAMICRFSYACVYAATMLIQYTVPLR